MADGYPLVLDTLGKLIEHRHTLTVYCGNQRCGHSKELDLPALAERLGPNHGSMHADLAGKLRCDKCQGRDFTLTLSPPTGGPNFPIERKP